LLDKLWIGVLIINKDKLVSGNSDTKCFIKYHFELFVKLVHSFTSTLLASHKFTPVIDCPSCEEENRVSKEAISKHAGKNLEHSFKVFINSRVLRIECYNKRVDVLNLLNSANHLSEVLCVSACRISEARSIEDEDLFVYWISKPVSKDTFSLKGM
jgi:transcription elongation factor Elf1